jgi:hypothetical protein
MTVSSLKNSAKMLCSAKQLPETVALPSKGPKSRVVSPWQDLLTRANLDNNQWLDLPTSSPRTGLQVSLPVECLLVECLPAECPLVPDPEDLPVECLPVECLPAECPLVLDLLVLLPTEALEIYLATH